MDQDHPKKLTDEEMVLGISERDEESLRALIETYGPTVKAFVSSKFRSVLQDGELMSVVNFVFAQAWRKIDLFDERQKGLKTWLLAIARNNAIDLLRKGAKQIRADFLGDSSGDVFDQDAEDPSEALERTPLVKEDRRELRDLSEIIDALPKKQKAIVKADLHCSSGVADAKRLAAQLGSSVNSIFSLRSIARKRIHDEMVERGHYKSTVVKRK